MEGVDGHLLGHVQRLSQALAEHEDLQGKKDYNMASQMRGRLFYNLSCEGPDGEQRRPERRGDVDEHLTILVDQDGGAAERTRLAEMEVPKRKSRGVGRTRLAWRYPRNPKHYGLQLQQ